MFEPPSDLSKIVEVFIVKRDLWINIVRSFHFMNEYQKSEFNPFVQSHTNVFFLFSQKTFKK